MQDLMKEPTRSWIHHGPEGEVKIDAIIWQIMDNHYPGAIDPKNPSLMAQRLFAISRSIYNDIEVRVEARYEQDYAEKRMEIDSLKAQIRELQGLPPLPPIATA